MQTRCRRLNRKQAETLLARAVGKPLDYVEWVRLRQHLRHCPKCFNFWVALWAQLFRNTFKKFLRKGGYEWVLCSPLDLREHHGDDILSEFLGGKLTKFEHHLVQKHVGQCGRCSERLKALRTGNPQQ